ncbi:MAG: D-hexose-6-phosphate mutarotase [Alphaproteobacteria bacterium]|nr:MAG: D-hexose-6-phosphate mutarotase [Alphaproteobacteria bacterium]
MAGICERPAGAGEERRIFAPRGVKREGGCGPLFCVLTWVCLRGITVGMITLKNDYATVTVSPYGAQVMSFVPHGQPDVLWSTTPAMLEAAQAKGKALRGGIPVCWPWFLAHPTEAGAPSHGLGRIRAWTQVVPDTTADTVQAEFVLELDGRDAGWPCPTRAVLRVVLTDALEVSLTTTNLGTQPFTLTQALHTYLRVGEIADVQVTGLDGLTRRHVSSGTPYAPHTGPFVFDGETEMLVAPTDALVLHDAALSRTLTVTNHGSREFVVWNPGAEKAAGLDMPPEDYRRMVCLEAANIDEAPVVAPGESHTLVTWIKVTA